MENKWIYLIIIIMTYLGAQASVFLKKASSHGNLKECICSRYLYLGGSLYIICALLNIWILKYLDYCKMLPLTSITYIWTLILAFVIFKEKISIKKLVGIIAISIGAYLVAY